MASQKLHNKFNIEQISDRISKESESIHNLAALLL